MKCFSCKEEYGAHFAGSCRKCYDKSSKTQEELKQKVAFLSFPPPLGQTLCGSNILADPSSPDVVLVASDDGSLGCRSATVPAHKVVLINRSPVFKAMFENVMQESRSGNIEISDASCDALRAFVNYLYTAEAPLELDEQMASKLLVLAEKYQVEHLKTYCEKILASSLNLDNSLMSYLFAQQQNAKLLLDAALCLMADNTIQLFATEDYKDLKEKDSTLLVGIHEAIVIKKEFPRFDDNGEDLAERERTERGRIDFDFPASAL